VLVFHGALACALYPQQPAAALAVQGLFFFQRNLNVESNKLSSVPIPGPNEWPRCDELTWLQIRGFIRSAIISSINPSQGAAKLSVSLPLPLTAIALLVEAIGGWHIGSACVICRNGVAEAFDRILGEGWDRREVEEELEINRGVVDRGSLCLR
jgi:hypothetical protein